MLKLFLHFYAYQSRLCMPIAMAAGLLGMISDQNKVSGFIDGFSLLLLTGGFVVAAYIFEVRHSSQYLFYNNKGLSRLHLLAGSYALNFILAMLLIILKIFLYV